MAVANEPTGNLKIMIMNTNGKTVGGTKETDKRKQVICDVVEKTGATLYLFQEFLWTKIRGSAWKDKYYELPSQLEYIGNKEACILFDKDKVTVENMADKTDIKKDVLERMCIGKVTTKGDPIVKFICISWHGRFKKPETTLKEEFESMLDDILKLSGELSLPVLLAGDFNLITEDIKTKCSSLSLVLHPYKPTERRTSENIIDFFISSKSLKMLNINALKLELQTKVVDVLSLFDHDPVVSLFDHDPVVSSMSTKDNLTSEMDKLSLSS